MNIMKSLTNYIVEMQSTNLNDEYTIYIQNHNISNISTLIYSAIADEYIITKVLSEHGWTNVINTNQHKSELNKQNDNIDIIGTYGKKTYNIDVKREYRKDNSIQIKNVNNLGSILIASIINDTDANNYVVLTDCENIVKGNKVSTEDFIKMHEFKYKLNRSYEKLLLDIYHTINKYTDNTDIENEYTTSDGIDELEKRINHVLNDGELKNVLQKYNINIHIEIVK